MLRFIVEECNARRYFSNFNTSHVTVYPRQTLSKMIIITHFNTSHVTVYRPKSVMYMSDIQNFNTSHVTVYRGWSVFFRAGSIISIHPMLRFINSKHPAIHQNKNFNTSHVTVYHYRKIIKIFWCHYFNTSHVTVYLNLNYLVVKGKGFQYIPCYGLSNDFKPFLSWHLSSFPLFYVISAFFTSRL